LILLKKIFRPWFVVFFSIFFVHQIVEKIAGVHIEIFDNYLDPLLFMPILLHVYLLEKRVLFGKPLSYILPFQTVVIICLFISIVGEWIFPRISTQFTSDWMDVLCYIAGSAIFLKYFNKSAR